jgi:hypothetical protein
MSHWYAGPHWVDGLIAFTLLEGLALGLYFRLTGRGVAPREFGANLVSGLFLMLALRAVLGNAAWPWIALCVVAAGLAHGLELRRRWNA